ncbi:hypothetical protein NQZ68_034993 [Dissostichus eleginoides]|nr:hypothetical protein NQZ68_034993 [Dissostichus eleginoides]
MQLSRLLDVSGSVVELLQLGVGPKAAADLCIHDCFNIDTKNPRIIKGPKQAQFGYTVQQHVAAGGEKW